MGTLVGPFFVFAIQAGLVSAKQVHFEAGAAARAVLPPLPGKQAGPVPVVALSVPTYLSRLIPSHLQSIYGSHNIIIGRERQCGCISNVAQGADLAGESHARNCKVLNLYDVAADCCSLRRS